MGVPRKRLLGETAAMANKFNGGAKVDGGYYWNPKNWEVEIVPDGGGTLAAAADVSYLKIPLLVAIPVAACIRILIRELVWPRFRNWARGQAPDPLPLASAPPDTPAKPS